MNKWTWKPIATEMEMREMYETKRMTQDEIAKVLGKSRKVVEILMRRYGIKTRVAAKRNQFGSANHNWKADQASYSAFHMRVESRRGKPKHCDECGSTDASRRYHWANLSGDYSAPDDYKRMCVPCHKTYDIKRNRS